jgi:hypothetical protein
MPRRSSRWFGALATGSFGLVALMAILLPASAAMVPLTVVHTGRISAPYTGATSSPSGSTYFTGCGHAALVTSPFFHWHSGAGGFSGSAAAHTCPGMPSSYAGSYQSIYTQVPFVTLSGNHVIDAKWFLKAGGANTLKLGTCTMPTPTNTTFSECYGSAAAYLNAYAYIYDATTGAYYASTNSWAGVSNGTSIFSYCTGLTCANSTSGGPGSFAFTGPIVWHFKATNLVQGDSYWLVTDWYGEEYANFGTYNAALGPSHGSAWLNAGTFGNGFKLVSITIR